MLHTNHDFFGLEATRISVNSDVWALWDGGQMVADYVLTDELHGEAAAYRYRQSST
ncbi:hypothetical protein ACFOMH_18675 [Paracoccus mangrovi]|uniref:Uncharacterized protein n=1 Tax=Paracoccus mangrovi TaxID=1715645 RepID=A0ABV7R844_9RHOB